MSYRSVQTALKLLGLWCCFFSVKCYLVREVDLSTQLLEFTAVDGLKLAGIYHKTAELLQSALYFNGNKYTPLYFVFKGLQKYLNL